MAILNMLRKIINYPKVRRLLEDTKEIEKAYLYDFIDESALMCLYVSIMEEMRKLGYGKKYCEDYFKKRFAIVRICKKIAEFTIEWRENT